MAITDPSVVTFCNDHLRPVANLISRSYYRSKELDAKWTAIAGTNEDKFNVLRRKIERVANLLSRSWFAAFSATRTWDSGSIGSAVPNDAAEVLFDNGDLTAPDPNRPQITGQDIIRAKRRMEEFTNWLTRGTDLDKQFATDATATLPITYAYFDDVYRLVSVSAKTPTTGWGRTLVKDRGGDLITEYETTSPNYLGHLLAVSVDPRPEDRLDD